MAIMEEPAVARGIPQAEVAVDDRLVRNLLRRQHHDLAELPIRLVATGWDNCTFRLGDRLAVRLPRIHDAAPLAEKEQHWLPLLGSRLPVPVPALVRVGEPDAEYPWPWSVVAWIPGRSAEQEPLAGDQAGPFGDFLAALHRPVPPAAPRNAYRGLPLTSVEEVVPRLERLAEPLAEAGIDPAAVHRVWQAARAAPMDVPEALIHGDLHPKNLVVDGGRLAGVLDWGDLTLGDPAADLAAAWMLFARERHAEIWDGYGTLTPATTARARGWAVFFGSNLLEVGLANDPPFAGIGRDTLRRVVGAA